MKSCPSCGHTYEDDAMSFCLDDGTPLINASESAAATVKIPAARLTNQSPTEVLPSGETTQPSPQFAQQRYASERMVPPERKSKALPWIIGIVLILGLSGIVIGLLMMRNREPDDSQVAQNTAQSENTTTAAAPTPNPTVNRTGSPVVAETPASEAQGQTQVERVSERPSPTTKPTPSPRNTPEMIVADEPPPPPPPTPTPVRNPRGPISGGVLNGKAISLPRPTYPSIARAARASGTVVVQVTLDESGKVISARAVNGHPLLQQAAVQAAYGARFSPTQLSGQPVKVTGVITYNFVAP
jgi:TonB family protein